MKFRFDSLPAEIGFSVFDYDNKQSRDGCSHRLAAGDHEFDFEIPSSWTAPHYSLAAFEYFVPDSYGPLDRSKVEFSRTGADFYLDVTREETREESNRRSVESIITATISSNDLDGRQKFYVALMALNSHFEFLVHTMLVVSGHISRRQFNRLGTHEHRINAALDASNTSFFANQFQLCPGKLIEPGDVDNVTLDQCRDIMQAVRKKRNEVAHGWGYNDLRNEDIIAFFEQFQQSISYSPNDDEFFRNAAQQCVILWAKVQALNTRAMLVHEKQIIATEREERGY